MKIRNANDLIRCYINHGTMFTVNTIQNQECQNIVNEIVSEKIKVTPWAKKVAEHLLTELQSIYC